MYVYMHTHTHTHTHTHSIKIHAHQVFTYLRIYIHTTHIQTYMHTHIYTHIRSAAVPHIPWSGSHVTEENTVCILGIQVCVHYLSAYIYHTDVLCLCWCQIICTHTCMWAILHVGIQVCVHYISAYIYHTDVLSWYINVLMYIIMHLFTCMCVCVCMYLHITLYHCTYNTMYH
jgi:hypothetical protein